MSLAGLGLLCVAFGLVVPVATRGWRGLDLPGDLYLWGSGAAAMGWWLGAAFPLLALVLHMAPGASSARRRVWPWAVSWGVVACLLGPEIVVERSSHLEPRELFIKRAVVDVVRQPWSSEGWLGGADNALCITREDRLFWGRQVPHRDDRTAAASEPHCSVPTTQSLSDAPLQTHEWPMNAERDYREANRLCSVAYAEFLLQQDLVPESGHLLHLTALIGRTQYPHANPEEFVAAEQALSLLPDIDRLPQCLSLLDFYLRHLPTLTIGDGTATPAYPQERSPLGHLYGDAYSAVRNEVWGKPAQSGDPQLAVSAVARVLAAQPPSFAQYCLWAVNLDAWVHMGREQHPELAASMRALPRAWATVTALPKPVEATCHVPVPAFVGLDQGNAWLQGFNRDLKQAGLPCKARATGPHPVDWFHPPELICRMATAPAAVSK